MMMASAELSDIWKPRETVHDNLMNSLVDGKSEVYHQEYGHVLRDWGKTEYKIVRNWTPRVRAPPQLANQESDDSPVKLNLSTTLRHFHSNRSNVQSDNGNHGNQANPDKDVELLQQEQTLHSVSTRNKSLVQNRSTITLAESKDETESAQQDTTIRHRVTTKTDTAQNVTPFDLTTTSMSGDESAAPVVQQVQTKEQESTMETQEVVSHSNSTTKGKKRGRVSRVGYPRKKKALSKASTLVNDDKMDDRIVENEDTNSWTPVPTTGTQCETGERNIESLSPADQLTERNLGTRNRPSKTRDITSSDMDEVNGSPSTTETAGAHKNDELQSKKRQKLSLTKRSTSTAKQLSEAMPKQPPTTSRPKQKMSTNQTQPTCKTSQDALSRPIGSKVHVEETKATRQSHRRQRNAVSQQANKTSSNHNSEDITVTNRATRGSHQRTREDEAMAELTSDSSPNSKTMTVTNDTMTSGSEDTATKEVVAVIPHHASTKGIASTDSEREIEEKLSNHVKGRRVGSKVTGTGRVYQSHKKKGSMQAQLWQPKGVKRTKKDFSELDVFLSVYEDAMGEALEFCSPNISTAMITHWKHTRKEILSELKNLHFTSELQKLQRKEKLKERNLEKKLSATLTSLRKAHGQYQRLLTAAKQAKKIEQEVELENELSVVARGLRRVWLTHTPHLSGEN